LITILIFLKSDHLWTKMDEAFNLYFYGGRMGAIEGSDGEEHQHVEMRRRRALFIHPKTLLSMGCDSYMEHVFEWKEFFFPIQRCKKPIMKTPSEEATRQTAQSSIFGVHIHPPRVVHPTVIQLARKGINGLPTGPTFYIVVDPCISCNATKTDTPVCNIHGTTSSCNDDILNRGTHLVG
jgi:hypothetical protein